MKAYQSREIQSKRVHLGREEAPSQSRQIRLDFKDAANVYNNPQKLTRRSNRQGEQRYAEIAVIQIIDISLTLVYTERGEDIRIISFRNSLRKERRLLVRSWQPDRLGIRPPDGEL